MSPVPVLDVFGPGPDHQQAAIPNQDFSRESCFSGSNLSTESGTRFDFRAIVKKAIKNKAQNVAYVGFEKFNFCRNNIRISGVIGEACLMVCCIILNRPLLVSLNSIELNREISKSNKVSHNLTEAT